LREGFFLCGVSLWPFKFSSTGRLVRLRDFLSPLTVKLCVSP
jgi:hypothetical protein